MRDLDFYIDAAQGNSTYKSDRMLSLALGKNPNLVNYYKRKGVFPSDDTMTKLADLAGIDCETALIELNMWRAPAHVRKTYANILQKLQHTAQSLLVVSMLCAFGASAQAGTIVSSDNSVYIYYGN